MIPLLYIKIFHFLYIWVLTFTMCDVLNVSETGYYRFKRNLGRPGKDAVLSVVMQDVVVFFKTQSKNN